MDTHVNELSDNPTLLKKIIKEQQLKFNEIERKYLEIEEKYLILRSKFFSRSSEKLSNEDQKQLRLFNEAESICDEEEKKNNENEKIEVKSYKRNKKGRKAIPSDIPRHEVIHDLTDEEKKCPCCGKVRPKIGSEDSEELDIIPAEIKVIKHIRLKYGPCKCEESQKKEEKQIKTAKMPVRLIPGSIVSPGLLAYILVNKFCDHLPFYRQEKIFKRIGVDISRANMCNWTIHVSSKLQDLLKIMWEEIRGAPFIQMDETTLQVLNEPGRSVHIKSYMWVTLGHYKNKSIVIYHYHPTRSKEIPLKVAQDYKGYLQTDGYSGYNDAGNQPGIIHVGCWAHARRYFKEALAVSKNKNSAREALSNIQKLYAVESKERYKSLSDEVFLQERKKLVLPIFDKLKKWLDKKIIQVPPKTKIGEAVSYTLGEWDKLIKYIEAPFITPDNNLVENAIRPFVLGRKNWLFSATPRGAHASACIYSLIETAKANGLDPYRYLRYLFTKIPETSTENEFKKLLPMNINVDQLLSV